jgi:hypothetical protein
VTNFRRNKAVSTRVVRPVRPVFSFTRWLIWAPLNFIQPHPIDPDRARDVFEPLLAGILEDEAVNLALYVFLDTARNTDSTGFRQRLEAGRHVHAIAPDVSAVDDDVADIYADAEFYPLLLRDVGVAFRHSMLHLHGALHRVYDASELRQNSIAGGPHDSAVVTRDFRYDKGVAMHLPPSQRAELICPHETAIARNVGCQDGREPSLSLAVRHDIHVNYTNLSSPMSKGSDVVAGANPQQSRDN